MISSLQRSFQRHFRAVFALLLGVTVISFIFTIGSTPGIGRDDRGSAKRSFFGHNLASEPDMREIMGDAQISAELQFGYMGEDQDQMQRYALQRTASLYLADKLGLPPATDTEITDYIKSVRAFTDDKGQFDPARYAAFRSSLKENSRVSEGDIARVISDDVRSAQVQKLLAGPGYVLPADVKDQLLRADSKWTLDSATVSYAAFDPAIEPTDADLIKFFTENSFRYEIPPRVSVDAVEFPALAYIGQVVVTEAEVRAYYDANPARFPKPAAAGKAAVSVRPNSAADYAAVRPAVEAALKFDRAKVLAAKAASDFAYDLYDGKVTRGPSLDAFLASHKVKARPVFPFTQEAGPAEYGNSKGIADAAFKLDGDRFYSEAVPSPNGSVILLWKELLPVRQPALAEVRAKVRADYIDGEKRRRFVELGRTLKAAIEAHLKAGDSFAKAAAAAGAASSIKVDAKSIPTFDLQDRPKDVDPTVLGTLQQLEKGQVSDMAVTGDKGILVYAADKKTPALTEVNPRYAEIRSQLAGYSSRLDSSAYLGEIVEAELKRSAPPDEVTGARRPDRPA